MAKTRYWSEITRSCCVTTCVCVICGLRAIINKTRIKLAITHQKWVKMAKIWSKMAKIWSKMTKMCSKNDQKTVKTRK